MPYLSIYIHRIKKLLRKPHTTINFMNAFGVCVWKLYGAYTSVLYSGNCFGFPRCSFNKLFHCVRGTLPTYFNFLWITLWIYFYITTVCIGIRIPNNTKREKVSNLCFLLYTYNIWQSFWLQILYSLYERTYGTTGICNMHAKYLVFRISFYPSIISEIKYITATYMYI